MLTVAQPVSSAPEALVSLNFLLPALISSQLMPPGVTLAPSSSTSQTRAGVGVLMGPWGRAGGPLPGAHGNLAAAVCVSVCGGGDRLRGSGAAAGLRQKVQAWARVALQGPGSAGCRVNLPCTQARPGPDSLCLIEFALFFK